METITDSCLKVLVCRCNYRDKEKWVSCARNFTQKRVFVGLSLSFSLQRNKFQPILAASAPSESDPKTPFASEETQINDTDEPKTVHVRFELQKECAFGQQFLIVGDDPVFGLWDPSEAIPLNWSDGHVWSVELDLPSGKVIKYKFILKGVNEEILWQPGPDRILQTREAQKMITVLEDWDNPELQMIKELEELVSDPTEESMIDSELMLVAENLSQPVQDDATDVNKETSTSRNGYFRLTENSLSDKAEEMVAENITLEMGETVKNTRDEVSGPESVTCAEKEHGALENDGSAINGSDSLSQRDEASVFPEEGVHVLVPGLIMMPTEETREESLKEVDAKNAANIFVESDKTESSDSQEEENASGPLQPTGTSETMINKKEVSVDQCVEKTIIIQSKEEYASSSYHPQTSDTMIDKKEEPYVNERIEKLQQSEEEDNPSKEELHLQDDVLKSDLRWGQRTLQKFLANLGFH